MSRITINRGIGITCAVIAVAGAMSGCEREDEQQARAIPVAPQAIPVAPQAIPVEPQTPSELAEPITQTEANGPKIIRVADTHEPIEGLEMGVRHVEIMGEGPIPMVLIPDVGFDWSVYESFMERNTKLYTMYALTLPGMVGTDVPPPRENSHWKDLHLTTNAIAAIRQMIRDHELNSPVVVGHGYGGHLASIIATRYPKETRAAISIDGPPYMQIGSRELQLTEDERDLQIEKKMISPFRYLTDTQWNEHSRNQMINRVTDQDRAAELADQYLSTLRGVVMQYSIEMLFSSVQDDLKSNQTPLLFIAPASPDIPTGVTVMRWRMLLEDNAANITLTIFEDCRHFVMDDDPWRLDPTVDDFIHGRKMENVRASPGMVKPHNPELESQEIDH